MYTSPPPRVDTGKVWCIAMHSLVRRRRQRKEKEGEEEEQRGGEGTRARGGKGEKKEAHAGTSPSTPICRHSPSTPICGHGAPATQGLSYTRPENIWASRQGPPLPHHTPQPRVARKSERVAGKGSKDALSLSLSPSLSLFHSLAPHPPLHFSPPFLPPYLSFSLTLSPLSLSVALSLSLSLLFKPPYFYCLNVLL